MSFCSLGVVINGVLLNHFMCLDLVYILIIMAVICVGHGSLAVCSLAVMWVGHARIFDLYIYIYIYIMAVILVG